MIISASKLVINIWPPCCYFTFYTYITRTSKNLHITPRSITTYNFCT